MKKMMIVCLSLFATASFAAETAPVATTAGEGHANPSALVTRKAKKHTRHGATKRKRARRGAASQTTTTGEAPAADHGASH